MRKITDELLDPSGAVLLTSDAIADLGELQAADFRDTHVVSLGGLYLGVDSGGRLVLCRGPAWMARGVWLAAPDGAATEAAGNVRLDAGGLTLVVIR